MTREELEEGQMDCPKTFQGTITKANLDGYLVYKNEIILIVCRDDSEKKYILPISALCYLDFSDFIFFPVEIVTFKNKIEGENSSKQ